MRTRSRLTMVLMLGVLTLMGPLAYGQTGAVSAPPFLHSPWKFEVAPYVWLPAMQGELTVRGHTADIDLDLGDTLDLLFDAFKFAAMGRAEARKGNLLLTLDLLYLNLEDDQTAARGLETEVGLQLLITEFGAGYRLGTWPLSPDVLPAVSFDVLAGGLTHVAPLLLPDASTFCLDFHPIPSRGDPTGLDAHYIPQRGQAGTSVLTFFAHESDSRVFCYANADQRAHLRRNLRFRPPENSRLVHEPDFDFLYGFSGQFSA